MTIDPTGKHNARKAYGDIQKTHGSVQTGLDGIWHWLNGVAGAVGHFFTGTVARGFHTVWAAIHTLVDAYSDFIVTYLKLRFWIELHIIKFFYHFIMHKYDMALAQLHIQVARLIRLIYVTTNQVLTDAMHAVRVERTERVHAIKLAEAKAAQDDRMLHQIIEREAASAYRVQHDQRVSTIIRLLEFAVAREPLLKDVAGTIVKGLLDLVAVDDPLLRLVLGFAIRDIIDKLGVDKLIGHLASDLLEPLLGKPQPRNLHDVVMDMGARLVAAESFEATFTQDGGSEIEQAGRLWRDITSPLAAAGIVAFTAAAVINPDGWAHAVTSLIGTPATDLIDATARLVKGP